MLALVLSYLGSIQGLGFGFYFSADRSALNPNPLPLI